MNTETLNIFHTIKESFLRNYYHFLLFSLLMMTIFSSFLTGDKLCLFLFDLFYIGILFISTAAAFRDKPLASWLLTIAFIMVISFRLLTLTFAKIFVEWPYHASIMFILVMSLLSIMYSILKSEKVNSNIINGALCGYIIIGVIFAFIYMTVEINYPHSFRFEHLDPKFLSKNSLADEFYYLSITTLTSLGTNDISPISKSMKHLTMIESMIGQLYLAIIIARLVGIHISQKKNELQEGISGED